MTVAVPYRAHTGEMRPSYPASFDADGLRGLKRFLHSADAVVPLRESDGSPRTVSVRHDVDHNLEHALRFARWEAKHGIRATYFVLHTAWYYEDRHAVAKIVRGIQALGHEVGLHHDTVAEAWRQGHRSAVDGSALPVGDCDAAAAIMTAEVGFLRRSGIDVAGVSAHGSPLWKSDGITNVFLWAAGYRPEDFGLAYEAYHLHRTQNYISDNRGSFSRPLALDETRATHLLLHPVHWSLP